MKLKWVILTVVLLLVMSVSGWAEETKPPQKALEKGDVVRFIKTFPLLKADFEKYGAKYEARNGDMTFPEAMVASAEFKGILGKHGWDDQFFKKVGVIILGYSIIEYGKQRTKADAEFEKSMKEIESNPNIPPAMKEQLKEQMKAARGVMQTQGETLKKNIHPEDLLLIKPHIDKLKETIDESKDK